MGADPDLELPVLRAFVVLALITLAAPDSEAQRRKKCTGPEPDSTVFSRNPVYRDCDVDRPARLEGREPTLDMSGAGTRQLRESCYVVELDFVVDTTGVVEPTSVTVVRSNLPELLDAVQQSVPKMLFRPAELDGKKVRQLVRHRRTMSVGSFTVTSVRGSSGSATAGSMPAAPSRGRAPSC